MLCKSGGLTESIIVLTPNQRLSRIAKETYDAERLSEKKIVWESLKAFPLQIWVMHLFKECIEKDLITPHDLLNASQINSLWQKVIQEDDPALLPFSSAAMDAWRLCHQYEVNLDDPLFSYNEETLTWQKWAKHFQILLKENKWIEPETVFKKIMTVLDKITLPKEIILLSFTDFSPFERKFITLLKNQGVKITESQFQKTPSLILKKAFPDQEAELHALAQWAYEKVKLGTVGCVIPELTAQRDKVVAIFERYFEDQSLLNISLGKTLDQYSLIHSALIGLQLLDDELTIETITHFLLSPFFEKSFTNLSTHALLDAKLKSQLGPRFSKKALLKLLENHVIRKLLDTQISLTKTQSLKTWADLFNEHLNYLGWPGEKTLSSEEFQLITHWQALLENLRSLSLVSGKFCYKDALKKLLALCKQTLFQPKRSPSAKIDILGILEATGLPFDYLWVMGLHEDAWPLQGMPSPFLPLPLQRKLNMPNADSTQNLKFCTEITKQLLSNSQEIILSYPDMQNDNILRPSLLIQSIPESEKEYIFPIHPSIAKSQRKEIILDKIKDDQAPRLNLDNIKHYGSEIFKDQSACPFRAFAKHRLYAKNIESPQLGIKALTKGNLVHKILEKFFKEFSNHEELSKLTALDLSILVNNLIRETLEKLDNNIFTVVEKVRLEKLILNWIALEKKREPFTVVATEESIKTYLGPLPLSLRIDRIDKIGEDEYLIIDYKTGRINFNSANALDEPQLPLYCVVSTLSVKNIAFAQLRPDEMELKKFKQEKDLWKKELENIAEKYIQGHATVMPKYGEQTCQYCELTSFCRVKEKQE
jgi:ATP-dependent helicase/nuclease subunit B